MAVMEYRTRDGVADYGFSIEFQPDIGWRIYIIFQPSYQGHDDTLQLPYQSIDSNGRRYVDWSSKIDNLGDARTVAALWAELIHKRALGEGLDSPLSVSVYLEDGHNSTVRDVQSALQTIAEEVGFELIAETNPVYGSFWQKFRAKASDPHTQQEVYDRLIKLERTAEVRLLAVPESQANMQNAQGLAAIIEALKGESAAVIQLGPMVVVKAPRPDCESAILCRMLTAKELRMLEADPGLLRDPIALMARLTAAGEDKQIESAQ